MAGQLFRKGTNLNFKEQQVNSEIGSGFFLEMLPICECNVVRIESEYSKRDIAGTFR